MGSNAPNQGGTLGPKTSQFKELINGVETEFVITSFATNFMVVVTQTGKLGTLIEAEAVEAITVEGQQEDLDPDDKPREGKIFNTNVLFGDRVRAEERLVVFARAIMKQIAETSDKNLLLGIHVHDDGPATFRAVVDTIKARVVF